MSHQLRYGDGSLIEFDLPAGALVVDCQMPNNEPLDDPAAAVAASLLEPVEYPPLHQAVIPGDRVAIALGADLPRTAAIVAGVVQSLLLGGIEPDCISIVQSNQLRAEESVDPRSSLPEEILDKVQLVTHDATDREQLSFLAADEDGEPIYLNRLLCEADVVLPIVTHRLADSSDFFGSYSCLYPALSDEKTIAQFHQYPLKDRAKHQKKLRQLTDQAGWQLGSRFVMHLIPGVNDTVLAVLCGDAPAVEREANRLCERAWRCEAPYRANLVIASIEGTAREQTWENVGRALLAAEQLVSHEGAIALCTQLKQKPGPAVKSLQSAPDFQAAIKTMSKTPHEDTPCAKALAEALQRGTVYFLSQLEEETVEAIGLAPITDPKQIQRIAASYETCSILSNAQYAQATKIPD